MRPHLHFTRHADIAFTLLQLLIVVSVCVVLFLMLTPAVTRCGPKAGRINCANNLKQVGLSYRLWAEDNSGRWPMEVSVTNGGTMELISAGFVAPHFTVLSNLLGTPKILFCPDDKERVAATSFGGMANLNVSYFVGLNATGTDPQTWLAGDRNITNSLMPIRGVLSVPTNLTVGWNGKLHNQGGNLVLADGSVQQPSSRKLNEFLHSVTNSPLRLAMPE